jgi:hypothetical protein
LLAGIAAYLARQIASGWTAIESLNPQWDGLYVAGALVSGFIAYQCLLLGWLILLWRTGHFRKGRLGLYARVWWVSYLYRYVPGKVLLLVERARLGATIGVPAAAGAALTIVETLLAILAGSAVSLLAISYYVGIGDQLLLGVVSISIAIVFLFPFGYRMFCDLPFIKTRYPELSSVALRARDVLIVVVPYVLHYLLLGASLFLISVSLQLLSWSDLPWLCGIYALSHVASLIALIAPGGLGVREGALALQLGRLLPSGVAEVLAIGARVWFTLIELVCYVGVVAFCPPLPGTDGAATNRTPPPSI